MNVPNTLTVIRLILVPVFVITMFAPLPLQWSWLPLAIIVLSGITDVADGYIARHFNQITQLGKILDPLADKLSLLALSICIAVKFSPFWIIAIVVIDALVQHRSAVRSRRERLMARTANALEGGDSQ